MRTGSGRTGRGVTLSTESALGRGLEALARSPPRPAGRGRAKGAGGGGSVMASGRGASSRWFFTREQLENTPSRRCGVEADEELSHRQQAANLIQDMGQRLNVYPFPGCGPASLTPRSRSPGDRGLVSREHGADASACFWPREIERHRKRGPWLPWRARGRGDESGKSGPESALCNLCLEARDAVGSSTAARRGASGMSEAEGRPLPLLRKSGKALRRRTASDVSHKAFSKASLPAPGWLSCAVRTHGDLSCSLGVWRAPFDYFISTIRSCSHCK